MVILVRKGERNGKASPPFFDNSNNREKVNVTCHTFLYLSDFVKSNILRTFFLLIKSFKAGTTTSTTIVAPVRS